MRCFWLSWDVESDGELGCVIMTQADTILITTENPASAGFLLPAQQ